MCVSGCDLSVGSGALGVDDGRKIVGTRDTLLTLVELYSFHSA